MGTTTEAKLKALREAADGLGAAIREDLGLLDKMIRDAQLGVEHLEDVQDLQLRLDRIQRRERARQVGQELDALLNKADPNRAQVIQLRFIQTLLLSDIDASKDHRLLDVLSKTMDKVSAGPTEPEDEEVHF